MMPKKAGMFAESTDVPVSKSMGEIMSLLVRMGAVAINQELAGGRVVGLSFVIPVGPGRLPFKLPVRVQPVFDRLQSERPDNHWDRRRKSRAEMVDADREQAERIAWRQLFWWLKAQLALIDLGMVQTAEVLMPYMLAAEGRTFFDTCGPRMLEAPEQEKRGA